MGIVELLVLVELSCVKFPAVPLLKMIIGIAVGVTIGIAVGDLTGLLITVEGVKVTRLMLVVTVTGGVGRGGIGGATPGLA